MQRFDAHPVSTPRSRQRLIRRYVVFSALGFAVVWIAQVIWPTRGSLTAWRIGIDLFFALGFGLAPVVGMEEQRELSVTLEPDRITSSGKRNSQVIFLGRLGSVKEFQEGIFHNAGIRLRESGATGLPGLFGKTDVWIPRECEGYEEVHAAALAALERVNAAMQPMA